MIHFVLIYNEVRIGDDYFCSNIACYSCYQHIAGMDVSGEISY